MIPQIASKRCYHHGSREAIAQCPGCSRFFCRECITETEERVMCSVCLETPFVSEKSSTVFPRIKKMVLAGSGFFFLWLCLYYLGRILIEIPPDFHEGILP